MTAYRTETYLTQIGNGADEQLGAVNAPVYFSTAYKHDGIGLSRGYDYIRTGNPTRGVLEKSIADIESGEMGFACSSGMSAVQLVFSLFRTGDHIIASRDLYGGTYRLFEFLTEQYGVAFSYWDGEDVQDLENLITKDTKAIFIESPTNPLMRETDLGKAADITKRRDLLLIVDNTFYTPVIQKPIELGADIVIHSATKYLGGHNDVLAGLVISKGSKVSEQLAILHNACGAVLSPFDSWLLIRGMKTLALRMKQHEANAKAVGKFLKAEPLVKDVLYPGRGGMLSFRIKDEQLVSPFLKALNLITFAESLGGVESLITYPATQTHADIPEEIRSAYGLDNCLLRLSVGIEHSEDLIADLKQAFQSLKKEALIHD
ncbi:cysteine synthase /cystathionine gamma-synthase [Scopulibacillus darangshiensis]|uniref:Cysteine synthase /cystathionine gamma-synthase n=1 Tax=Scopulibacillus darangshiensis TaxID=442528 RepID=A0A4R2NFX1_9BACL|nr:methionine biosynthesis PLP-dependent protein [Scopulibacillus darangshiensis]TCP20289.1 cysteine synthase /cystathionine gamma-synthase [Scopulibacillus darangshiensis]